MTTLLPVNRPHRYRQFEFKDGPDVFSPKDLIQLPRPGNGIINPGEEDLVLVSVSQHSFETKKSIKTIYVAPLASTVSPIEFPIINGGEVFWLDSRTVAHIVDESIYAVSLEYSAPQGGSHLVHAPLPPYFVGSFPSGSSPTNFKFTGSKKVYTEGKPDVQPILVFSAKVYPDYNLTTVTKQDEAWANRDSSGTVYDGLYVRHWDEYSTVKKSRLFSVKLTKTHGKWAMGNKFYKILEGTDHYTPVEPFGGAEDYDVSGTQIIYTAKDPLIDEATHTRQNVYIAPLQGGVTPSQVTTGHQGATHTPIFNPQGTVVAWAEMAKDGYESDRARVVIYDLAKCARWYVTEKWDRSVQEMVFARDGKSLFITASEQGHVKIFHLAIDALHLTEAVVSATPIPYPLTERHSSHGLHPLNDNKLVFTQSSFTGPNNVYLAELSPSDNMTDEDEHRSQIKTRQITKFDEKELKNYTLEEGEQFWFEGAEGKQVQGWTLKPRGYDPGVRSRKKWPVAFMIHGGPQSAWEDGWSTRWNANVFAQQGYWVILVNPTGSTGFGQAFVDAITEDWGGKPFIDLKHGWEYALSHYPIDKYRSVAAGASWGGYAINWIQGHYEYGFNFTAMFCHDGIFDTRYAGYSTDELYFWDHDFGGVPWTPNARKNAEKFNPADFVARWSTPQLTVHGGKDYRLAETEGLSAFNALQQRNVSSRLLLFPDENHWVLKPANSLKWHYEVLRWFDEWAGDER
ncbi:hypothetical protein FRB93_009741 [Tulasnella sp. JGI-2019a]|nr:hypothetical protein FRB93_009741 [Tulasnella sp. JGI-2019a]